jgi:hypothetical protein
MKPKFKIGLYIAAIFMAGVITGIFISYQVARHMMPGRANMSERWCNELQSKLNLTPPQVEKIRPFTIHVVDDFRDRLCHEMLVSLTNNYVQIATELTPDQKVKLEQLQHEQTHFISTLIGGKTTNAPK